MPVINKTLIVWSDLAVSLQTYIDNIRIQANAGGGGGGTNYTDDQAKQASSTLLNHNLHTGLSFSYDAINKRLSATVAEQKTNAQITALAKAAISAGSGISITDGVVSSTITQFTNSDFDTRFGTKTTDNLTQGLTNKYFTQTVFNTYFSAKSSTDLADSASLLKTSQKGVANGVVPLDASNPPKIPSQYLPSLSVSNVSAGLLANRPTTNNVEGDAYISTDAASYLWDGSQWQTITSLGSGIQTVNGKTGSSVTLTTNDVTEGTTNKYYSDTLARNAFSAGTGIGIANGVISSTLTSWTDATIKALFSASNGISYTNGAFTLTNGEYTDTKARTAIKSMLNTTTHSGITFDANGAATVTASGTVQKVMNVSPVNGDVTLSLDNFNDSTTTNKFFTETRARAAFTAGTGITITNGQISTTATSYTDAQAKAASVVNSMSGTQTDVAPSVASVKSYFTAGTGVTIANGQISASATSYTFTKGLKTETNTISIMPIEIKAVQDLDTPGTGKPWMIPDSINDFTTGKPMQVVATTMGKNVVLPAPSATNTGCIYHIKNMTSVTITITGTILESNSGLTLDGAYSSMTFISDGTKWMVI